MITYFPKCLQLKDNFCATSTSASAIVSAKPAELYTDKYDGIEIKEILSNRRFLLPYLKCLLDQGKCSPEGKELKCRSF